MLEHFMLPSADKLYRDADFIFQQDLPTLPKVPKAGSLTMVLLCLLASKLAWPEPQENLFKRKMRDTRPNNVDDLKAAIKATWASLHLSSATGWLLDATPHWCSNSCIMNSINSLINFHLVEWQNIYLFHDFLIYWDVPVNKHTLAY